MFVAHDVVGAAVEHHDDPIELGDILEAQAPPDLVERLVRHACGQLLTTFRRMPTASAEG